MDFMEYISPAEGSMPNDGKDKGIRLSTIKLAAASCHFAPSTRGWTGTTSQCVGLSCPTSNHFLQAIMPGLSSPDVLTYTGIVHYGLVIGF